MLTSKVPQETACPQIPDSKDQSLCAIATPPRWIPTRATPALSSLRSAISCAIRARARWMAAAFKIRVESGMQVETSKSQSTRPRKEPKIKLQLSRLRSALISQELPGETFREKMTERGELRFGNSLGL